MKTKPLHPIQVALLDLMNKRDINRLSFWEIGRIITKEYGLKANHAQIIKHHLTKLRERGFIRLQKDKDNPLISIPILPPTGEAIISFIKKREKYENQKQGYQL